MKSLTEWMNEGHISGTYMQRCKKVLCEDGTEISIQASSGHYCQPRKDSPNNSYDIYESFEIGFPTREIECLRTYAECDEDLTETVYGYVPKEVVEQAVADCGGIVGFAKDAN